MDYWEFAQFLVMLAIPRLRQFLHLAHPCSADMASTYTASLERFIQRVSANSNLLTFFNSGALPVGLNSSKLPSEPPPDAPSKLPPDAPSKLPPDAPSKPPPDALDKCLHPEKAFVELISLLPWELRQVVEDGRCESQLGNNVLVFRSFEVYTLSRVAKEVGDLLQTLSHPSNQS